MKVPSEDGPPADSESTTRNPQRPPLQEQTSSRRPSRNSSSNTNKRLLVRGNAASRSIMWGGSRHRGESVTAIVTNALEREEQQLDWQLKNYLGSSEKRISARQGMLQDNQLLSDACLDLGDLASELAMAEEAFRHSSSLDEMQDELDHIIVQDQQHEPTGHEGDEETGQKVTSVNSATKMPTLPEESRYSSEQTLENNSSFSTASPHEQQPLLMDSKTDVACTRSITSRSPYPWTVLVPSAAIVSVLGWVFMGQLFGSGLMAGIVLSTITLVGCKRGTP